MSNMTKPVVDLNAERHARGLDVPKSPRGLSPVDDLSFMKRRKRTGPDYWAVVPSGNYVDDCETGRALAAEFLAYIGEYHCIGSGTLLACIVRTMTEKAAAGQKWSGINTAFLNCVNSYAMAAATVIEGVQVEC